MKEIKVKNALPVYACAAVWLLSALLFKIYRTGVFITTAVISIAVYAAVEKFGPKRTINIREKAASGEAEVDRVIDEGRVLLDKLGMDAEAIGDPELTVQSARMLKAGYSIFDALENNAGKYKEVRRFLNYYLPTAGSLIEKYRVLISTGVDGQNITSARTSIENSFQMIADAFEKQLDFLYRDEALNIEADIEVLDTVLQTEGLKQDKNMTMMGGTM